MKKIVIFDLDGTLFDTTRAMQACGNYALENLGYRGFSRAEYALFSGGGVEEYVGGILEAAGDVEKKHFQAFWDLYLEKNSQLTDDANVPYDGIGELLSDLKNKGIALAVLSNKDQASCVAIVEKIFGKETFSVIRGDTGLLPVKPDPSGVFAILEQMGLSREDALYVGDTAVDIETGKRAGVMTAAVLWGYRTRELLEKEDPDHLIAKPSDILDLCLSY